MTKENNSFFQEYWSQSHQPSTLIKWKKRVRLKIRVWQLTVRFLECFKRFFDFSIVFAAILLFSPLLILIAFLIKLEDGGPVFYRQLRTGKRGHVFSVIKFRSMTPNAEQMREDLKDHVIHAAKVAFKVKNDPRMTKIGRLIRRFSLDEFPQLFNVLAGDMALVGPRPFPIEEAAQYNAFHLRRLAVKPGITCLWQISGRSDIDFEGQVRLDLKYIHSKSILTDIKILIQTIPAVIFGKGAY